MVQTQFTCVSSDEWTIMIAFWTDHRHGRVIGSAYTQLDVTNDWLALMECIICLAYISAAIILKNYVNGSLIFHCSSLEEVWVTVLNITGPLSSWSFADNRLPGDLILSNYGFVIEFNQFLTLR